MTDDFSIGVLAQRTGVTPNVLRTWEHRFGFPAGRRTTSGHRRFTEADVLLVGEVQEARDRGVPLHLAVDAVLQRSRQEHGEAVHATLIREFPDLRPQRLGKATLIAASHAIEEEVLARADRSVVLGTFQEGHKFARSRHRWEELARTATWSAVLAEFDDDLPADPQARPARCQLSDVSPMRREWTVVALSPTFAAVLAAWEVPAQAGRPATYEAVITMRRAAALAAARVIVGAARSAGATPPPEVAELLAAAPSLETTIHDADRVMLRMLEHADARLGRRG
ncbi:DICT sensory domain-containing protein [Nocardioides piscis]|uniref:MerR family transcriptional regulator n=1 Tax=Nocardioides piscis TaxID=2714938 RepID=A0A6G7YCE4_9ACTN|nr:DICT sensory domain-containing protein [Nocardioides piscis]QIK74346.1 MerR family transcriptional regulator [Nocardioides piscis]